MEEAFPDKPQLYPSDPVKKSKQKIIVETMGKAVGTHFSAILLYFWRYNISPVSNNQNSYWALRLAGERGAGGKDKTK